MQLNKDTLENIFQHALQAYPYECCGIITGDEHAQTVHRCENIQNKLHAEDPARYPRDARTAYVIDRKEFDRVVAAAKDKGDLVAAFYHSHPEHEAYFSEEDAAAQTVFGEPEFPDALHIVISVMNGRIHDITCFKWDGDKQGFISLPPSSWQIKEP
ncbi:MAG: M67 family metallopeptidase [Nitrospirae bacterium]|nr:M67 family metallopeptidase [Nitrospirota bacterium]